MMPFTCLRDTSPVASTTALMSALLLIEPGFLPPSAFFAAMCFSSGKWVSKRSAHTTIRKRADPEGNVTQSHKNKHFAAAPSPGGPEKVGGGVVFPCFVAGFCEAEASRPSIVKKQS